jgi:hypothetical protein
MTKVRLIRELVDRLRDILSYGNGPTTKVWAWPDGDTLRVSYEKPSADHPFLVVGEKIPSTSTYDEGDHDGSAKQREIENFLGKFGLDKNEAQYVKIFAHRGSTRGIMVQILDNSGPVRIQEVDPGSLSECRHSFTLDGLLVRSEEDEQVGELNAIYTLRLLDPSEMARLTVGAIVQLVFIPRRDASS